MGKEKRRQFLLTMPKKEIVFGIKNKKIASINKNGRITAKKKGTTYLFVKVKDSDKNQCRIKIVVKEEPWIVSEKDQKYDYAEMTRDLRKIARKYPGKTGLSSIGRTYDNREIWCLRVGNPSAAKKLVIDAAIHAREWKIHRSLCDRPRKFFGNMVSTAQDSVRPVFIFCRWITRTV